MHAGAERHPHWATGAGGVRSFDATKRQILSSADWLRSHQVHTVVMEATGAYLKAPFVKATPSGPSLTK